MDPAGRPQGPAGISDGSPDMTKAKPPRERRKLGRKPTPGNDEAAWIAIEFRRGAPGWGRTDRKSLDHAIKLLMKDLGENTSNKDSKGGWRKRYDRTERRRDEDPQYKADLDYRLAMISEALAHIGAKGPGLILPSPLRRPRRRPNLGKI